MVTTPFPAVGAADRPRAARRTSLKLLYGVGSVAYGVKDNGFQVLLLLFYNQALGLDARLAGLAIMAALLVDALVDPMIGYWSDRLRSPWGRRHPFMYAAAVPVALSYLLLFSPPGGLGQTRLFLYLLAVSVAVRVLISFYEIPNSALVAELTDGYDERTAFLSVRYFFGWMGGLTMSVLAFSVFLRADAAHPSAQLDIAGYGRYGVAAAAIMFASMLASSLGTHAAVRPLEGRAGRTRAGRSVFAEVWSTVGSRSAVTSLLAGTAMMLATALSFALGAYFYIYAYGLSPGQISALVSSSFVSAALALVVTPWLAGRYDKRRAAALVAVLLLVLLPAPLALSLAGLLPTAASGRLLPVLFVHGAVLTTFLIAVPILLSSMLADVVEEAELRTGRRDEGVVFALNTFAQKCASGLGVFGSTAILAVARFPAQAQVGAVPADTITRLSVAFIAAVALLYALSLACIVFYPISREQHARHVRLLSERRAAAGEGAG